MPVLLLKSRAGLYPSQEFFNALFSNILGCIKQNPGSPNRANTNNGDGVRVLSRHRSRRTFNVRDDRE
jgi:hypothetical protein